MEQYDYIIFGGGSSGCVMASRLSEDPGVKVLLIESGRRDSSQWIHIPATFFKVVEKGVDVVPYVGEKSDLVNGRESVVLQGHVIGGGCSVNAMLYVRGQAEDYDGWAQDGNRGWSFGDVLPAFRDLENNMEIADEFHGSDGELHVSETGFHHPLSRAFIRAAQQTGIPYNADFNGANQEGVGFYQTTTHDGRRWSSAAAFLRKAEGRKNLRIMTETRVARITFDGTRATGVELENGTKIGAAGEVVLCAGAIETPRLMQLSGIGNAEELGAHGICTVANLPGVGENFQHHLEANVQAYTKDPISFYKQDKGIRAAWHMAQYQLFKTGLLTSNVVESGGFVDVSGAGIPDVQFHVIPFLVGWVDSPPIEAHGMSINPCFLRTRSRGSVKLRSANAKDKALFDAGSFKDPEDLEVLLRGTKKAIEIYRAPEMQKLVKGFAKPGPEKVDDDDALRDWIRSTCKTVFHPCGTAKMGPDSDKMSVVGTELRVKGVQGLRVADASIMPRLVSGNTNAPTMMIAERAARFITGKETLSA
ncbi:GMC family oxidoreductase [Tropicibacter naphthalenivorans]|uniref:Alcohol dehydrogenase [acceptor] n=1 Tax=Tropicibacter naphthalenivorans TaxID=441103 RepID=A0A0P1GJL8_9RHOB|nr:GMC family oxidoreductase N-terminal domain-containing protein [Tropicibacter naphthalenivorans]CUH82263.1 Alcohol dehydrogenase [acceptor] [Tropicibacter naphthalenivorans]SMD04689.1 Choline dehydrogenase [Tropicibacter naphthalenivorans]